MRRLTSILSFFLLAGALAAACSSSGGSHRNNVDSGGNGAGATGGNGQGGGAASGGTGGIVTDGGGTGGATGGTSGDGGIPDVTQPDCPMCNADNTCPADPMGNPMVCTISNNCGTIGKLCASDKECTDDTYCCRSPECRRDGVAEGVCIPANCGPGPICVAPPKPPGVFAPSVQCEWRQPEPGKPHPEYASVLTTPLVADTPHNPKTEPTEIKPTEIIIITYNGIDGCVNPSQLAGANAACPQPPGSTADGSGFIRILDGDNCREYETIEYPVRASVTPAVADLDGDPTSLEIVAMKNDSGLVAFKWDGTKYAKWWEAATSPVASISDKQTWSGISIHNLDEDDIPEVMAGFHTAQGIYTFNGRTGAQIGAPVQTGTIWNAMIPVIGDFDADGKPEMVTNAAGSVYMVKWLGAAMGWEAIAEANLLTAGYASHFAFADFDLDGKAEIVTAHADASPGGEVMIIKTDKTVLMQTTVMDRGGPPLIGDFDGDGKPEVAIAGATKLHVLDVDCTAAGNGCLRQYVKWEQLSQDSSSAQTGATVFDFEGDGKAEIVYADECFLRIYEGPTGEVLYSAYRTSGTFYESPVVADTDNDDNTEIIVNSGAQDVRCPSGSTAGTPFTDPLHRGLRCQQPTDCPAGLACDSGFCRCTQTAECADPDLVCEAPPAGTPGAGNTCRSQHPNGKGGAIQTGIRVLRDGLDRWASSRNLWNQHAYSITNINDNGTVPKMSAWVQNFAPAAALNNYRAQRQGTIPLDAAVDITGLLLDNACQKTGETIRVTGRVCNRGKKAVGSELPVTFYDQANMKLCTAFTLGPVPTEGCVPVECTLEGGDLTVITMVANDDGMGGRNVEECNYDNNTSTKNIAECPPIVCGAGEFPCPSGLICDLATNLCVKP